MRIHDKHRLIFQCDGCICFSFIVLLGSCDILPTFGRMELIELHFSLSNSNYGHVDIIQDLGLPLLYQNNLLPPSTPLE